VLPRTCGSAQASAPPGLRVALSSAARAAHDHGSPCVGQFASRHLRWAQIRRRCRSALYWASPGCIRGHCCCFVLLLSSRCPGALRAARTFGGAHPAGDGRQYLSRCLADPSINGAFPRASELPCSCSRTSGMWGLWLVAPFAFASTGAARRSHHRMLPAVPRPQRSHRRTRARRSLSLFAPRSYARLADASDAIAPRRQRPDAQTRPDAHTMSGRVAHLHRRAPPLDAEFMSAYRHLAGGPFAGPTQESMSAYPVDVSECAPLAAMRHRLPGRNVIGLRMNSCPSAKRRGHAMRRRPAGADRRLQADLSGVRSVRSWLFLGGAGCGFGVRSWG